MKIVAISDLHLPKGPYLTFLSEIKRINSCDIFLIAGDVIDSGRYIFLRKFENDIKKFNCPKIMVRGNNEYTYEETKKYLSDVILLEDDSIKLEINGKKVLIVGTQGILDRPTYWQRRNIPNVEKIYQERFEKVRELLKENADIKIVLSHYTITFANIIYEPKSVWPELGSNKWMEIINEFNIGIHGHVHKGRVHSRINNTDIYNASIWNGKILEIDL